MTCAYACDQLPTDFIFPQVCGECQKEFCSANTKHHCRACGGGFCERCSSKYMAVPWRGWGNVPVRVCVSCYKQAQGKPSHRPHKEERSNASTNTEKTAGNEATVTARYMGEVVQSALGLVTGAISYPKGVIVESARPSYWVPDAKIKHCNKCKSEFGPTDSKHHCRGCGEGFCDKCSTHQIPVPSRGWDYPVRVCDLCVIRRDLWVYCVYTCTSIHSHTIHDYWLFCTNHTVSLYNYQFFVSQAVLWLYVSVRTFASWIHDQIWNYYCRMN